MTFCTNSKCFPDSFASVILAGKKMTLIYQLCSLKSLLRSVALLNCLQFEEIDHDFCLFHSTHCLLA